jgi:hypothetical protein
MELLYRRYMASLPPAMQRPRKLFSSEAFSWLRGPETFKPHTSNLLKS